MTLEHTGLSMQELDEATRRPEFAGDALFQSALMQVAGEGRQLLGEAQQSLMQLVGGG